MKKILLSLGAVALMGFVVNAQEANIGLKIGMMQTQWYGDDVSSIGTSDQRLFMGRNSDFVKFNKSIADGSIEVGDKFTYVNIDGALKKRWGFHAGFQINSEINEYFWLKHEFFFATKGFGFTGTLVSNEVESIDSQGITYVDTDLKSKKEIEFVYRSYNVDVMPISLAFHFEGMQLFAGPYISVMVASNWHDNTNDVVVSTSANDFLFVEDPDDLIGVDIAQKDAQRSLGIIDYGFVAGFEYELPFGLNAGIRYVQGFASMFDTPDSKQQANVYNKDLRFSLGYTFGKE